MCGIVGAIAKRDIVPILLDGLERLEYRGYDSAGLAVLGSDQRLQRVRRVGRVAQMQAATLSENIQGTLGIGHTRWATHGEVTEPNAHPHISQGHIAVVHNGIIENHETQRERLLALGYTFESQTDTEVIAHLVHYHLLHSQQLFAAVSLAIRELTGTYAIALIALNHPDELICARMGCPLILGLGNNEYFIASDVPAIVSHTRRIIFLEDGDCAQLSCSGMAIIDKHGQRVERPIHLSDVSLASLELGAYSHYMQKEIHEQPKALTDTIEAVLEEGFKAHLFGQSAQDVFTQSRGIKILACGTSYYAGLTAKYWLESIARLPCDVEIASEYRYRDAWVDPDYLVVTLSQSGETLDTLEALKYAKSLGHTASLSICNVTASAIVRASDLVFYTRAGAEIGVASTKAFTTQLVALFTLAVSLGQLRGHVNAQQADHYLNALRHLPGSVQHALNLEAQIKTWAECFATKNNALFLGRGLHYPIALEGALKLKEISYIHAEAYPAGELKHGPLALVDKTMPVVVIAPNDRLLEKVKSNLQEVRARGGELFVFTDLDSHFSESTALHLIRTPRHVGILSPIVHAIPVQLLAYHTACMRSTDVDKPRNLAKSVTVE